MSDGMTDAYRDEHRAAVVRAYYRALMAWLKEPSPTTANEAIEQAKRADSIRHGYFTAETDLAKNIEQRMKDLAVGEEETWINTLADAGSWGIADLVNFSPFKGMTLILYRQSYAPSVLLGGKECRAFTWVWNEGDHIVDNGIWVACN